MKRGLWGLEGCYSTGGGSIASDLLVECVDIVDHEKCVEEYVDRREVDDSMICAGVKSGGKGACRGDDGGPLVDASSKKQVGVVSWGFGCGKNDQDGVNASTAAYLDWIQGVLSV